MGAEGPITKHLTREPTLCSSAPLLLCSSAPLQFLEKMRPFW